MVGRKLIKTQKVLCLCAGGKVRSACCRWILEDTYGFMSVLTAGLEKWCPQALSELTWWADRIVVVGEGALLDKLPYAKEAPESTRWGNTIHIDVGPDRWGHYGHKDLAKMVGDALKGLVNVY